MERPELLKDMREVSKIARSFMKNWDSGVLSTQFKDESGEYPFGSICPFVITLEGEVIILISNIATHTKNILANPRVGFTVFDMEASHKQAASRVSITAEAQIIEEDSENYSSISERYFTFFPMARNYFKAHKFFFYSLTPKHIHYIKTFGQIYSFEGKDHWPLPYPEWSGNENSAIEHMNQDHKDSLKKYAKELLEIESDEVSLMAVDSEGFHLKINDRVHYLNFQANAHDAQGLRREFVNLSKSL